MHVCRLTDDMAPTFPRRMVQQRPSKAVRQQQDVRSILQERVLRQPVLVRLQPSIVTHQTSKRSYVIYAPSVSAAPAATSPSHAQRT